MDLEDQQEIQTVVTQTGKDRVLVMLGASDPEVAEISAVTVTSGDPTYTGPLAGVPLGLPVYHILESQVREQIPAAVFSTQVGMMEMVIDAAQIEAVLQRVRGDAGIAE